MSFARRAEGIRSKLHLTEVRAPAIAGACLLALAVAGVAVWGVASVWGREAAQVLRADEADGSLEEPGHAREEHAGPTVFVHVTGAVAAPGLYELSEGARVNEAIDAAGGFAEGADTTVLNLARVLVDGEQVVVPTHAAEGDAVAAAAGDTSAGSGVSGSIIAGKVNINRADVATLDTLPGVGESTAQKIIADREANGPFASIEDLKRVSGIGEKKFEQLADLICVS